MFVYYINTIYMYVIQLSYWQHEKSPTSNTTYWLVSREAQQNTNFLDNMHFKYYVFNNSFLRLDAWYKNLEMFNWFLVDLLVIRVSNLLIVGKLQKYGLKYFVLKCL